MEYRFFTGEVWQEQSLIWERARLNERILKELAPTELPNAETFRDILIEHFGDELIAYNQFCRSLGLVQGIAYLLGIQFDRKERLHYEKSRTSLEVYEFGMKAQGRGLTLDEARRFAEKKKQFEISKSTWHDAFKRGFELSHPGEEFGTKSSRRRKGVHLPEPLTCDECEKRNTAECIETQKISVEKLMYAQPCPLIERYLATLTPSDSEGHAHLSDHESFLESEDLDDPTE